jgi:signal peptidase II
MLWIILAVIVAFIDQASKYLVNMKIQYGERIPVINEFFYLTRHTNKGAAWGILQNARSFLIIMTIAASAVIIYLLFKTRNNLFRLSLSFILGGAVGNLIDRVFKGAVTDFLDFYFGKYNFPTFNLADSFITIGTILLAYYLLVSNASKTPAG